MRRTSPAAKRTLVMRSDPEEEGVLNQTPTKRSRGRNDVFLDSSSPSKTPTTPPISPTFVNQSANHILIKSSRAGNTKIEDKGNPCSMSTTNIVRSGLLVLVKWLQDTLFDLDKFIELFNNDKDQQSFQPPCDLVYESHTLDESKFGGIHCKEKEADYGIRVHAGVEERVKSQNPVLDLGTESVGFNDGFLLMDELMKVFACSNLEIVDVESEKYLHNAMSRIDLILRHDSLLIVAEIKTVNDLSCFRESWKIQLSMYHQLLERESEAKVSNFGLVLKLDRKKGCFDHQWVQLDSALPFMDNHPLCGYSCLAMCNLLVNNASDIAPFMPNNWRFPCHLGCGKDFVSESVMIGHTTNTSIHSGIRRFSCSLCSMSFFSMGGLKYHNKAAHTGDKPYECDICEKRFVTKGNLTTHLRIHTGEKPYECEECGKRFVTKGNLTSHKLTHTGELPYECPHCPKRFAQSGSLTSHIRTHTGEKPFQCHICEKSFSEKSNLTTHIRIHTGEKPYECDVCGKRFACSNALTRHIRVHTGEKPYECDVCGKRFACSNDLTRHIRTHTGELPYECPHCPKRFAQSGSLTRHIRTHTG